MTPLRVLFHRLYGLVRKGSLERDMDDELDFHLQMEVAESLRKGMTPDEARSQAQRRLGGVAQLKETYRETHALPVIEVLWQDIRFGFRMLRRSPGFALLAILCLTLGIGRHHCRVQLDRRDTAPSLPAGHPPGEDDGGKWNRSRDARPL